MEKISKIRNIGISAHIDSGKTTLSERILFYCGRIHRMQEVHDGNGEGGATMDFMDLERERGITITSAATQVAWSGKCINLIDTPGHVDFTVEVERSLRVLDGAIMILCAVGGVQSQSFTVDQQMKRYRVPRIAFINKMDRTGADPERVRRDMREKLGLNVVPIQLTMGIAESFQGVIDLVTMEAMTFEGDDGEDVVREPIPAAYAGRRPEGPARDARGPEHVQRRDDGAAAGGEARRPQEMIRQTIREATINRDIVPLMMGSAFKNKGVQPLLDAVCDYLPSPLDRSYFARDHDNAGTETPLAGDPDAPLVAMVFKITDEPFGQLSYIRVYQGTIVKGGQYRNARTSRTLRVGRIVRMHANDRQDITDAGPGDIVALLAVECANGDTLCGEGINYSLESIYVADPVISLSVTPASNADQERMAKALSRFMKEDPTFRVSTDPETSETDHRRHGRAAPGHLRRADAPRVQGQRHRRRPERQLSRGPDRRGQVRLPPQEADRRLGPVRPRRRPLDPAAAGQRDPLRVRGQRHQRPHPRRVHPRREQGLPGGDEERARWPATRSSAARCAWTTARIHAVDSSEMAFRIAARDAFAEAFRRSKPCLMEPIMKVEVEMPREYQGAIVGDLNSRRGIIHGDRGPRHLHRRAGRGPAGQHVRLRHGRSRPEQGHGDLLDGDVALRPGPRPSWPRRSSPCAARNKPPGSNGRHPPDESCPQVRAMPLVARRPGECMPGACIRTFCTVDIAKSHVILYIMYIERIAERTLTSILAGSKVGIVLGARQVGKTTLVEHVIVDRNASFLNFDVEIDKQRFRAAAALPPLDGLKSLGNPEILVVDEAQRLPDAPRVVKGWYDARLPVKILLLGSSSLNLLNQAAESLTGATRSCYYHHWSSRSHCDLRTGTPTPIRLRFFTSSSVHHCEPSSCSRSPSGLTRRSSSRRTRRLCCEISVRTISGRTFFRPVWSSRPTSSSVCSPCWRIR